MSNLIFNCFVIMPFSQSSENHTEKYWTTHFEDFLKPLIEEVNGVQAFRIETLREDILKQIITNLVVSPIVIAELTDYNPNVFWELGVRQSFKHGTITITEEGTVLPFDISAKTTLFYNHDKKEISEFRIKLKKAISDCIENPNKVDSHVLETISGRGSLYEVMKLDEVKRRIEALILELKLNLIHLENAQKIASKMKEISYVPYELRFSSWKTICIEHLLSTRYLEEDSKFYSSLQFLMEFLTKIKTASKWLNTMNKEEKNLFLDFYRKTISNKYLKKAFQASLKQLQQVYQKVTRRMQIKVSKSKLQEFEEIKPIAAYGWSSVKKNHNEL